MTHALESRLGAVNTSLQGCVWLIESEEVEIPCMERVPRTVREEPSSSALRAFGEQSRERNRAATGLSQTPNTQ